MKPNNNIRSKLDNLPNNYVMEVPQEYIDAFNPNMQKIPQMQGQMPQQVLLIINYG